MKEGIPPPPNDPLWEKKKLYSSLVMELSIGQVRFPFPEMTPEDYEANKRNKQNLDTLLKRFRREGFKLYPIRGINQGILKVVPGDFDEREENYTLASLFLEELQVHEDMDPRIKTLIEFHKDAELGDSIQEDFRRRLDRDERDMSR